VVVVDASPSPVIDRTWNETQFSNDLKVVRIQTSPGLPHQRNIGIDYILSEPEYHECDIVTFLDDDVVVAEDFFEQLITAFNSEKNLVCLGAVSDLHNTHHKSPLILRVAKVSSRKPGEVLSSGFATPPVANSGLTKSHWVPGLAMSFRKMVFQSHRFNERIAFYGEDLEFQLRISHLGTTAISSRLRVTHRQSPLMRDAVRESWAYSDGFRWSLASNFPKKVKKKTVLWAIAWLLILESLAFLRYRNRSHLEAVFGHSDFLCRLFRGEEVEKLRVSDSNDPSR